MMASMLSKMLGLLEITNGKFVFALGKTGLLCVVHVEANLDDFCLLSPPFLVSHAFERKRGRGGARDESALVRLSSSLGAIAPA